MNSDDGSRTVRAVEAAVVTSLRSSAERVHPSPPGVQDMKRRGRGRRRRARFVLGSAAGAAVAGIAATVPLLTSAFPSGQDESVATPLTRQGGCPVVAVDLVEDPSQGRTEYGVGTLGADCQVTKVPTDEPAYDGALSPDGERMASVSPTSPNFGPGSRITVSTIDGTDRRVVFENDTKAGDLTWSPDGDRLAFWQEQNSKTVVYVLDLDSLTTRRLTSTSANSFRPLWEESGERIAVLRGRRVVIFDADGSNERVVPTQGRVTKMAWSPDGTQMAVLDDPAEESSATGGTPTGAEVTIVGLDGQPIGGSYRAGDYVTDLGWDADGVMVGSAPNSTTRTLTRLAPPSLDPVPPRLSVDGEPDLE